MLCGVTIRMTEVKRKVSLAQKQVEVTWYKTVLVVEWKMVQGKTHFLPLFPKRVLYVATGSCPESNQKLGFEGQQE